MKIYIRATGNISPQKTFGHPSFLTDPVEYTGDRLTCIEPDYRQLIDVKMIRRMSRIIKMGVAAAIECLREAGQEKPDGIITGTSFGCLEDTTSFLAKMVENKEELLTPTAFIQSTHNTVGAQVALITACNAYNNTFVHRGFSFESALLDSMMLLLDREAGNVLVGSIDEITETSHRIMSRFGIYKNGANSSLLFDDPGTRGTMAGEGASFFLLASEPSSTDYGCLQALTTFYKPTGHDEIQNHISSFLASQQLTMQDIDLVITGRNGDFSGDRVYASLAQAIFNNKAMINYKNLCGEYPTSGSFAMWLAAWILKTGSVPTVFGMKKEPVNGINKILVYNHFQNIHHSLLLISAC